MLFKVSLAMHFVALPSWLVKRRLPVKFFWDRWNLFVSEHVRHMFGLLEHVRHMVLQLLVEVVGNSRIREILWYLSAQDSDFGSKYAQHSNFATIKLTNDWLPSVLSSQWGCVELSPPLTPG